MKLKLLFFAVATTVLGSTFKKCNRNDDKFNECLLTAIEETLKNAPIEELGLPSLDPLEVKSFVIAPGKKVVNFEQKYSKIKIKGLSKTKCTKAEIDFEVGTIDLNCDTPLLSLEFLYEINGKILMLPIVGKGPGFLSLENLHLHVTLKLEKNGKEHYRVKNSETKLSPRQIKFRLDNLFNGDKILGENINKILNENWMEIFEDVRDSYEGAIAQILLEVTNMVLEKLTISELFGEK